MRAREVEKLQTGDVITCGECPDDGCDGSEVEVTRFRFVGGVVGFKHTGNPHCFAFVDSGYVLWAYRDVGNSIHITGRSIKLVRRAGG